MKENQEIENLLKSLIPSDLTSSYLDCIENAMNHCIDEKELEDVELLVSSCVPATLSSVQLDSIEGRIDTAVIESDLTEFASAPLSNELFERLEFAMNNVQETAVEVDVIDMPRKSKVSLWNVAAAIVLAASLAIVINPFKGNPPNGILITDVATVDERAPIVEKSFSEESLVTMNNVVNASNEGVVMSDNKPHQMLKLYYEQVIQMEDEDGQIYEVKKPMVKVILVPTKTN